MGWRKEVVKKETLYMREWMKTEAGLAYREKSKAKKKARWERTKEHDSAVKKRNQVAVRLEVLQHYSGLEVPECKCCEEKMIAFLHIDHIEGGGRTHRKENKIGNGPSFHWWLKKNGWPEGFQVLCANCNIGKHFNGGECPHKKPEDMTPKNRQDKCNKKVRLQCLTRYSEGDVPACVCCGETIQRFLHIDHINGDGAAHRRALGHGGGGHVFYSWLRKNKFPEGYQTLCANCNLGKFTGSACPHKQ